MRKRYKRVPHYFEGMYVQETGDNAFALRISKRFSRSVLPVALGANARDYLIHVSDQRGACLVKRPAKDGLCL